MPSPRKLALLLTLSFALGSIVATREAVAAGHSHRKKPTPPPAASSSAAPTDTATVETPPPPPELPAACVDRTRAELRSGETAATRLELAKCEADAGALVEALRDAEKALREALEKRDIATVRAGKATIDELTPRIPHVTFAIPSGTTDLVVTFDDRPVPVDGFGKKFAVNPGPHAAHAEGKLNSVPLVFDKDYDVKEGELVTVAVVLTPAKPEFLTQGQLSCMVTAKSQEEVLKCLPENRKNLVVKAGLDMSAYSDTDHVHVFTPSINGSISSPTAGWNVGASYLVDVVSAASPDIVSEASPPFHEVRQGASLTGGYKPKTFGVQAQANGSSEPDYLSLGAGIAMLAELNDKLITPRIAYNFSYDTIGRSTTPFNVFHHNIATNEFEAGTTFVLSSRSLLLINGTLQVERGDQSKPYRYVPMFDASVAPHVAPGQSIADVNAARLNVRPLEQLPNDRNRYAVGLRFAHRFSASTLRVEERLYHDSWEQSATTTDMRFVVDVGQRVRVWPHGRLNLQNGTDFYRLAYSATVDPATNAVTLPRYRTDDRELSPLVTVVGGGGFRVALTGSDASVQLGVSVQADVMWTRFFDALFLSTRLAEYGTIGIDAEFE